MRSQTARAWLAIRRLSLKMKAFGCIWRAPRSYRFRQQGFAVDVLTSFCLSFFKGLLVGGPRGECSCPESRATAGRRPPGELLAAPGAARGHSSSPQMPWHGSLLLRPRTKARPPRYSLGIGFQGHPRASRPKRHSNRRRSVVGGKPRSDFRSSWALGSSGDGHSSCRCPAESRPAGPPEALELH